MKIFFTHIIVLCGLLPIAAMAQLDDEYHGRQNATINFYGKVVDNDGKPLAGAKVNMDLVAGEWRFLPVDPQQPDVKLKTDKLAVEADANGAFGLTNLTGRGFDVTSLTKEGYELSGKVARSYSYSATAEPFHPDPNNPVIFKMWKKGGAEPLASSKWGGKVVCDGTTNRFDLLGGQRNPDGNLEIVCTRVPLNILKGVVP